ncbi:MAG: allantoicase [Geodermatophilaceae bacterium]
MSEPTAPEFTQLVDLAARRLGGGVLAANDELFAERENLVKDDEPAYSTYTFGPKGQIYDGWETRRRREPGYDWAVVRLGVPGVVRGVIVDTAFFKGNYPPEVSVEGVGVEGYPAPAELDGLPWFPLVPRSPVDGDRRNPFVVVDVERRVTHVRVCMYPDGGIARLRVHGEPVPDPRLLSAGAVDLAALENGGDVTACSNMFYSSPRNLISPGQARLMGEGWETARRRDDSNDFVEFGLAGPGVVRLAELDTSYFVGNAPGWASLRGRAAGSSGSDSEDGAWVELLPKIRLQPDTRHRFRLRTDEQVAHVRLDVYPDGGLARVRLWGELAAAGRDALAARFFDLLPAEHARAILTDESDLGAEQAAELVAARPLDRGQDLPAALRAALA